MQLWYTLRMMAKHPDLTQETLLSLVHAKSKLNASHAALSIRDHGGWKSIRYIELSHQARDLSCYLMEQGVEEGDRIAILGSPGPHWGISFFAALHTGCLVVPLDTKLTEAELFTIFNDCHPRVLLCASSFIPIVQRLQEAYPALKTICLLDIPEHDVPYPTIQQARPEQIYPGRDRGLQEDAILLYTSGTTGEPKGVLLSFGSIVFEANVLERLMGLNNKDQLLSILPLNHLLELTCGFMSVLNAGGRIHYTDSLLPQEILDLMREKRITFMVTVPLFLKLLKTALEKEISQFTGFAGFCLRHRKTLSRWFQHPSLRKWLYFPLHQRLGGRLRGLVCGGAPLELELAQFFDELGIPVYHGYGLSETGPVIAANSPGRYRLGSVGKPLPGVAVKISTDDTGQAQGEILTRGPHVMNGYYQHPDWTRAVMDEAGWFHTGDLGMLDNDGFLYITGRLKSLIVLGGGKKVQPEEVEVILAGSPKIKEVCVVGLVVREGLHQGSEQVCAVIVPTEEKAALEDEVARLSESLAPYKRPTRVILWEGVFPKTVTQKIKRAEVKQLLETAAASGSVSIPSGSSGGFPFYYGD